MAREATTDVQPIIDASREKVRALMDRDGIPGASVVLIADGQPVWMEGFGATDVDGKRPIDPHTIFSLQSTSKTFAATAVMIAVQRGLLDLDRPITAYVPDFSVASRHERDPQKIMTLRHLLSHRAGFTHEAPVGGNFEPDFPAAAPDFEAHVASISRTWLRYPVGERYAYSNLGIDLAGYILMQACRASYGECLKALIFDPLGMADTTAAQDVYVARENRAIGHQPGFEAVPVRIPLEASGGVYSSATDMACYAAFHLGRGTFDGRSILDREPWEVMHTPTFDGYPYALGILKQTRDLEKASVVTFTHNGGGFGFGSSFIYCPDQHLAWVVLYSGQTQPGPPAPFDDVALRPILEQTFGPPIVASPPAASVIQPPKGVLRERTGTYVAGQSILAIEESADGLGFRESNNREAYSRLAFTSRDTAYVAEGPRAPQVVQFHPARGEEAAWVEFDGASWLAFSGASGFDANDSERDPPGSIGDRYDRFLGFYDVKQWGKTILKVSLSKKNGHLYLSGVRAIEHLDGVFFSGDGEALDLRGERPTFRNIQLTRSVA
ncbi:MAG TPA: serine hydrolase domain-containing protein [Caulobacteraceae bacterium]